MAGRCIIQCRDEYLSNSIAQALEFVSIIQKSDKSTILFDLSNIEEMSPALALSLIVYCSKSKKNIQFTNLEAGIKTIAFDTEGLKPDVFRESAFKAIMEGYSDKSYTPIVSFPSNSDSDYKDIVSTVVEDLIIRQLGIQSNVATGLKYIIEETLDNVTEHSRSDRGFIFAKANPGNGYLDISIADRGITLLGSYKSLSGNEIADDLEAIKAANRGISSKNLAEAENRGYGIYTSKKMIIDGLRGQYMMISGGAFYLKDDQYDNFFFLPEDCRWEGTVVSFRLYYNSPDFSYIKYIE